MRPATAAALPPDVLYEQRIGERLPLELTLADESGQSRPIGEYFANAPVVLVFGYFRCPQLCSIVSDATQESLRALRASPGTGYQFLYISIDPTDTVSAAWEKKRADVRRFGRPGADEAWHYLTGSEESVQRLAAAAGFHYRYDSSSRQYAHPSGFVIATPTGVISRYFLGVDFPAKDVSSALQRAADGKTGESVFELILLCFHGQGVTGRYGPLIWRILQGAVVATVIALAGGIYVLIRSERRLSTVPKTL